jgi:BlaI family transcriptional regulator, penicillinase repressor
LANDLPVGACELTGNTPSRRELSVLKALWELGPASVRSVHERLAPAKHLAFNTVQTVLRILERKGLVEHRCDGRRFVYTARYTRRDLAVAFLREVFDGQIQELVDCLLSARQPHSLDESAKLGERRARQVAAAEQTNPGRGMSEQLGDAHAVHQGVGGEAVAVGVGDRALTGGERFLGSSRL